jgi:hypothetical protein
MVHRRQKNIPKDLVIKIGVIALIILVISIAIFIFRPKKTIYPENISLFVNNKGYYLEVAQNKQSQQKGLSNRNELCFNCGMLFVFDKEEKQTFWMKDTHIPLDIIWLNSKYEIIKIVTAVKTNSEDLYTSDKPAKYVIELNANESFKLGLKVGDTLQIPSP